MPPETVSPRLVQLVAQLGRVLGQEALRAELGVEVAGLGHLVQVLLPADLVRVAGNQTPHESGAVPRRSWDRSVMSYAFLSAGVIRCCCSALCAS